MAERRIGLFGGSFNPVHFGHLRSAEEVREQAGLAEVWLIPAAVPPHKPPGELAAAAERLRMLELALGDAPHLRVLPVELARAGPSYTFDTLRGLTAAHPDTSFALILGLDAFRELHTWHRWEELIRECDLIVTSRPPDRGAAGPDALSALGLPIAVQKAFWYETDQACFRHRSGRHLDFIPVTGLDISASRLRELVRAGRSIRFLTPPPVIAHIAAHGLYRENEAAAPLSKP